MSPIERNETYTKWEQDAITMLLLHLCALLICLYLGEMGYAEDTAPVIFVLAVFLTGFFTNGYLWSLLGSLLSVFVVNYFFTEPFSKLSFSGPGYPITFVTLFVVGILTSAMTIRSRDQQRLRAENEKERTRGNLLRAVSHDLRTPLTAISGAINTVLEQQDTLHQHNLTRSGRFPHILLQRLKISGNFYPNQIQILLSRGESSSFRFLIHVLLTLDFP